MCISPLPLNEEGIHDEHSGSEREIDSAGRGIDAEERQVCATKMIGDEEENIDAETGNAGVETESDEGTGNDGEVRENDSVRAGSSCSRLVAVCVDLSSSWNVGQLQLTSFAVVPVER